MCSGELEQKSCRGCGKKTLKKVFQPINSAKFSSGCSKRSSGTRTGVGEIQFSQGAKKKIDEANK